MRSSVLSWSNVAALRIVQKSIAPGRSPTTWRRQLPRSRSARQEAVRRRDARYFDTLRPTMSAAKKPKKPGRRANPGEPTVRVDPALKRAYDNLIALISKASAKEAEDFDTRWEAAARIVEHEPPLYVFGGYKSADDFYRKVMNEEPRNARRFMRVAKLASPRDEETYGVSKLDAALAYVEAKLGHPLEHPPLPVHLSRLRIGGLTLDEAREKALQSPAATKRGGRKNLTRGKQSKNAPLAERRPIWLIAGGAASDGRVYLGLWDWAWGGWISTDGYIIGGVDFTSW
jgi:hypothetical protein